MQKKNLRLALLCGALFAAFTQTSFAAEPAAAPAAGHEIARSGAVPSAKGSDKWFVGNVRQDSIAKADQYSHNGITVVTFEPSARTFWHLHPMGQRLLVTSGRASSARPTARSTSSVRATTSGARPTCVTGTAPRPTRR